MAFAVAFAVAFAGAAFVNALMLGFPSPRRAVCAGTGVCGGVAVAAVSLGEAVDVTKVYPHLVQLWSSSCRPQPQLGQNGLRVVVEGSDND